MANLALADRRSKPRYPTTGLVVCVRRKGRLQRLEALAHDFNRHGIALILDQPLPKEATVYLKLSIGEVVVDNLIGVTHNCIGTKQGYRCGIQFRTKSTMQFDQHHVEQSLHKLEQLFKAQQQADAGLVEQANPQK